MTDLPEINYSQLAPTRDYLQDIAKVIGKTQQQFIAGDPNDWYKGLLVTTIGISSQKLGDQEIIIDLQTGEVRGFGKSWRLGEVEPVKLSEELKSVTGKPIEDPEFTAKSVTYDPAQAKLLSTALYWANQEIAKLTDQIAIGVISPVLLFPHHFDVSMVWFPKRQKSEDTDENQYTFGFSTGDKDIPEPYFYITNWPESPTFTSIKLTPPAHWQKSGFSGAILNYKDTTNTINPTQLLDSYFQTILKLTAS